MQKTGFEEHFFTVRGRGFDSKQWRAIVQLVANLVKDAQKEGISVDFSADGRRLKIIPKNKEAFPLIIWKKGEPGIPKRVVTHDGLYDGLVQSVLTVVKKVAPDLIEITSPDGRDYRRIFAKTKQDPRILQKLKNIVDQTHEQKNEAFRRYTEHSLWDNPKTHRKVKFISLPREVQTEHRKRWEAEYGHRFDNMASVAKKKIQEAEKARAFAKKEQEEALNATKNFQEQKQDSQKGKKMTAKKKINDTLIRKAAIRVAASTEDKQLKLALLEILKETAVPIKTSKVSKTIEDVVASLGKQAVNLWVEHKNGIGFHSNIAKVFPEIYDEARRTILAFIKQTPTSKVASGSTYQRIQLTTRLAKEWIQEAIKKPGRVREYLGIPEGEEIPMSKLNDAIKKVKEEGDNKSLLSALLLAKRLKKMND